VNGFIDHFNTRLGTTSNYSATANLHNSQITTAPAKIFQAAVSSLAVPWKRLVTVEILQLHALKSSLQIPIQNSLGLPNCPPYNSSARTE
jgi:hypothetical protein